MSEQAICITSKEKLGVGSTSFLCPNCSKVTIHRCFHCRELAARYKCPDCGFEGPN